MGILVASWEGWREGGGGDSVSKEEALYHNKITGSTFWHYTV